MGVKRLVISAISVCCAVWIAVGAAGCGGGNGITAGIAPPMGLPWPPPASLRQSSASDFNYNGSDYALKSNTATEDGNSLLLSGGGDLPWAIFAQPGLSSANELVSLGATSSEAPLEAGDGTKLYIALANFGIDSWEWFAPDGSPWAQDVSDPQHYRGPGGMGYVAVALAGPGTASVDTISIHTSGNYLPAPQNLTAEATMVELVELDWDDVIGAGGYNVYRAAKPDMSGRVKVNSEPVPDSSFEDYFIDFPNYFRNRYVYYQVTAVGAIESAPSNTAKVWVFGVDAPAPQNFRVEDRTAEMIRVAWDWEGPNPSRGFRVFIDTEPDFHIDEETENYLVYPHLRSYPRQGCEKDVIYYFKVCIETSQYNYGRLSPEISASVTNYWDWSDVQTITTGQTPLRALKIGSEFAVAYFNGPNVDVAVSDTGVWSSDTALWENGGLHIYAEYLGFAHADDTYLVTAWESRAGDSWAAYGTPGNWTRDRIHGDGNTALFHPESGFFCTCATNGEELAVIQLFNQAPPNAPQLLLHTKMLPDGSWNQSVFRQLESGNVYTPEHNLTFFNGDLYYLGTHGLEAELYFTSRNGGWVFDSTTDIAQEPGMRLRKYLDLTRFNDKWYSTAYDAISQRLYMLDEADPLPWNLQAITPLSESTGYYARMDSEGAEAMAIFYGGGSYHFARYSKDWNSEIIIVPGVDDFGNSAEILLSGGEPYFIFRDDTTGEIKIARGVPPEE